MFSLLFYFFALQQRKKKSTCSLQPSSSEKLNESDLFKFIKCLNWSRISLSLNRWTTKKNQGLLFHIFLLLKISASLLLYPTSCALEPRLKIQPAPSAVIHCLKSPGKHIPYTVLKLSGYHVKCHLIFYMHWKKLKSDKVQRDNRTPKGSRCGGKWTGRIRSTAASQWEQERDRGGVSHLERTTALCS